MPGERFEGGGGGGGGTTHFAAHRIYSLELTDIVVTSCKESAAHAPPHFPDVLALAEDGARRLPRRATMQRCVFTHRPPKHVVPSVEQVRLAATWSGVGDASARV